jgi:hypothetical protein
VSTPDNLWAAYLAARQSRDKEAINEFAKALLRPITSAAERVIRKHNLDRSGEDKVEQLAEELVGIGSAVIAEIIPALLNSEWTDAEHLWRYVAKRCRRPMSDALDLLPLHPVPAPSTRRQRVRRAKRKGESDCRSKALKAGDMMRQLPLYDDREVYTPLDDDYIRKRGGSVDPEPTVLDLSDEYQRNAERYADPHAAMEEGVDSEAAAGGVSPAEFLAWFAQTAERLADDDLRPAIRLLLEPGEHVLPRGRAAGYRKTVSIAAIARKLSLPRQSLVDRLRKLAPQIVADAPEAMADAAEKLFGMLWEAANGNDLPNE